MKTVQRNATLLLLFAILLYGVWFGVDWYLRFNTRMQDAHAAMQVGMLIVDHIEAHGQWPRDWEAIKARSAHGPDSEARDLYIADLKSRVQVNFEVTLNELVGVASHETPPFPVVQCWSGHPPGPTPEHDANFIIFDFLNGKR